MTFVNRVFIAAVIVQLVFIGSVSAEEFAIPDNTERSTTKAVDPNEVVRTAKLPPGFQLSVIAAEPDVHNPIAMTWDERGRLWVAENYSWAGGGSGGFQSDVRDRILILEDTTGDGTLDKRTVFWDEAHKLTSIEIGDGGVYAICLPELLFIPDKDRNDIPDGKPVVVLDGFDASSGVSHTPANGLKWGPDGWLYGRHGILATSNVGKPGSSESQRFPINTGIWRYHPQRDVAEAVMHGMTNSWGFDFDQHGEMFVINTVIGHLWHVIPGAHTVRMFGLDMNRHSYQLIKQVADHVHWDEGEEWSDIRKGVTDKTSAAGGGHAHIGLMIYQGDNWPEEYRNRVYTLNLHGRRLNAEVLKRKGAGYTATHGSDFCFMEDPWYRGMELLTGPDGGVYIADWSDTGECHDHDGVHRSSGRIYKLTYGTPKPLAPFDLQKKSTSELISLLAHKNTWWARQARRQLTQRADQEGLPQLLKRSLDKTSDSIVQIRLLETIATTGNADESFWLDQMNSEDEYQRNVALKFLVDLTTQSGTTPSPAVVQRLQELATQDPSGIVLLHIASSLQRLPLIQRWPVAEQIAKRDTYTNDELLQLMVWYGIEPAVSVDTGRALAMLEVCKMPLVTEFISRRLTLEIERNPQVVDQMLIQLTDVKCQHPESVISGMAQALNGWQKAPAPKLWSEVAARYGRSEIEEIRNSILGLNVVFGDGRGLDEVRAIVTNTERPAETRQAALRSLLVSRPADYVPTLLKLLDDKEMTVVAIRGLAQYDDPTIPKQILDRISRYDSTARTEVINTLASRPSFAKSLLDAVEAKQIEAREISAFQARQIASLENEELNTRLKKLWGDVRVSPAEKRAQIEAYREQLTPEVIEQADLSAGRLLYQKTCASCHVLYGQGRILGPDLTGSNRKNIDYLLENVIDPSASVGNEFRTVMIVMEDGRVLNGVVGELNERTLTLKSAQESITLDRNEIEEMKTSTVSLMPEGQLQKLSPEETRDLIAYLMSTNQVPLPQD